MDEIRTCLANGVSRIYTQYSAVENPEKCGNTRVVNSRHQEREMLFVVSGSNYFRLNKGVYKTKPGDLFMIDSMVPHWYRYIPGDNDLIHLWIFLRKKYLEAACLKVENGLARIMFPRIYYPNDLNQLINRKWNLLIESGKTDEKFIFNYMRNTINLILEESCLLLEDKGSWKNSFISVIEMIKQHIEVQHGRNCSLKQFEQLTGYSRDYIVHGFKKMTGITIGDYINEVRIAYTAKALSIGIKQKEIAFELGFSTPANFWNWMQNHREEIENQLRRM